ncbi:MAM33 domain-containing protein [Cephalotus follicularis]|uniref:MAM33 domain-containing protein n=1 Tax=Cephalotus follicularis TaxID=3775 RepID=A0A1Q3BXU1_CEPFO|nr:MAM33 domain-containing protein [Cephalotus follicularis]
MIRRMIAEESLRYPWRMIASRRSSSGSSSSSSSAAASVAVNSILLRSLKDHYLQVSKMTPPPKVGPPSSFTIVKGALDGSGPVLKRTYGNEEISVSVMRLANIMPEGSENDDENGGINQLFLHVDVAKPGQTKSLHFLCGLYPDALGIHSVSMRPKAENLEAIELPSTYNGPVFQDLDERMRDALHHYIDERGVNELLFPFLQAWVYLKDHRNLMRWFKFVGIFINESS